MLCEFIYLLSHTVFRIMLPSHGSQEIYIYIYIYIYTHTHTHIQDIKLRVIINLKKYHQPKPLCAALLCNLFFEFQIKVNIVNITDKICTRPGWVLFSHS